MLAFCAFHWEVNQQGGWQTAKHHKQIDPDMHHWFHSLTTRLKYTQKETEGEEERDPRAGTWRRQNVTRQGCQLKSTHCITSLNIQPNKHKRSNHLEAISCHTTLHGTIRPRGRTPTEQRTKSLFSGDRVQKFPPANWSVNKKCSWWLKFSSQQPPVLTSAIGTAQRAQSHLSKKEYKWNSWVVSSPTYSSKLK